MSRWRGNIYTRDAPKNYVDGHVNWLTLSPSNSQGRFSLLPFQRLPSRPRSIPNEMTLRGSFSL